MIKEEKIETVFLNSWSKKKKPKWFSLVPG